MAEKLSDDEYASMLAGWQRDNFLSRFAAAPEGWADRRRNTGCYLPGGAPGIQGSDRYRFTHEAPRALWRTPGATAFRWWHLSSRYGGDQVKYYLINGVWKDVRFNVELKVAPIQTHSEKTVPWDVSAEAWKEYAAQGHGDQSHERLCERGGFGAAELAIYLYERIKRLEHQMRGQTFVPDK